MSNRSLLLWINYNFETVVFSAKNWEHSKKPIFFVFEENKAFNTRLAPTIVYEIDCYNYTGLIFLARIFSLLKTTIKRMNEKLTF
jgi:hypothetical protein